MKPESKSYRTALGHPRYPPVRKVDLEPTGKKGNERENSYDPLLIVSKLTPETHLTPGTNSFTLVYPIKASRNCNRSSSATPI